MPKKKNKKIEEIDLAEEKAEIQFCTECGDVLENFSVSELAKDPEAVKENFHNCKKTGKFKGDVCSKIYIISSTSEEQ